LWHPVGLMRTRTPRNAPPEPEEDLWPEAGEDWLEDAFAAAERRRRRARIALSILAAVACAATAAAGVWLYRPDSPLGRGAAPAGRSPARPLVRSAPPSTPAVPVRGTGEFVRAPGT